MLPPVAARVRRERWSRQTGHDGCVRHDTRTAQDAVVLVHGLWVHGVFMEWQRRRVARCGYRAVSFSYPSMRLSLGENAERLARFAGALEADLVHFVGHSLGGLIVLRMLEGSRAVSVGRVVLEGSPYQGNHAAHRLAGNVVGRCVLGRSMTEWLAAEKPRPAGRYEIGVIAGRMSLGLGRLIAPGIPRPNDGVVSVEETRVPGARDHITLNVSHSGMLLSAAVARQICAFLGHGRFDRTG